MGLFTRDKAVPEPAPEPVALNPWSSRTCDDCNRECIVNGSDRRSPSGDPCPYDAACEKALAMWPEGEYRGRLAADGAGHLLAAEGDWPGHPVFHNLDTGRYEYVAEDGPSHNQIHHARVVAVAPTRDATENQNPEDIAPHHTRPTEDDPHYAADGGTFHPRRGWSFTRPLSDPDEIAPLVTGHTDAYTQREEA